MFKNRLVMLAAAMLMAWAGVLWARSESQPATKPAEGAEPAKVKEKKPWAIAHPDRSRRGRRGRLTAERETETLSFLKANCPAVYQRLVQLREEKPRRYRRAIHQSYAFMERMKRLPKDIRGITIKEKDAKVRIVRLIGQIRKTDDLAEKNRLKQQLRQAVSDRFQAEQKLLEYRLSRLEEQIKQLRKELKERQQQREQIIAERLGRWLSKPSRPAKPGMHLKSLRPGSDMP